MKTAKSTKSFTTTFVFTITFSVIFLTAALLIYFLLPNESKIEVVAEAEIEEPSSPITIVDLCEENEDILSAAFQEYFTEVSLKRYKKNFDTGLELYRQPLSRSAVEWFYFQITGNKEVTKAILCEAEKNEIPLSLAFALAHTESNFNATAINKNTNESIDRGLFQLNNKSFPGLGEDEFFDPYVSSKYGMSHLRFCINTAGNEVSALAMYNAGTNRVRSNKTPQTTLNYVSKIMAYQKMLDQLFSEQVFAFFEPEQYTGITVAYNN